MFTFEPKDKCRLDYLENFKDGVKTKKPKQKCKLKVSAILDLLMV